MLKHLHYFLLSHCWRHWPERNVVHVRVCHQVMRTVKSFWLVVETMRSSSWRDALTWPCAWEVETQMWSWGISWVWEVLVRAVTLDMVMWVLRKSPCSPGWPRHVWGSHHHNLFFVSWVVDPLCLRCHRLSHPHHPLHLSPRLLLLPRCPPPPLPLPQPLLLHRSQRTLSVQCWFQHTWQSKINWLKIYY